MFSVETHIIDKILTHSDIPVIHLTLALPIIAIEPQPPNQSDPETPPRRTSAHCVRRITHFYAHLARVIETHADRKLRPVASSELDAAFANSRRFDPWRIKLSIEFDQTDYELTLAHTIYANLGGDERERRFTNVWDAQSGLLRRFDDTALTYLDYLT